MIDAFFWFNYRLSFIIVLYCTVSSLGFVGGSIYECIRKHTLVYLWRIFEWIVVDRGRLSVVHINYRHTGRIAMLQVRRVGILAVRERGGIWRRDSQPYCQYHLADRIGNSNGSRKCIGRCCVLYYDYWNTFWKTVFQDREAGADAVWSRGQII